MNLDVIDIETNPRIADCVVAILKNRIRDHRQSLKKYYLSFSDYEDARKKKPNEFITQANWEDLCDYWDNDKTKVHTCILLIIISNVFLYYLISRIC